MQHVAHLSSFFDTVLYLPVARKEWQVSGAIRAPEPA
jgi:hypothetical protein